MAVELIEAANAVGLHLDGVAGGRRRDWIQRLADRLTRRLLCPVATSHATSGGYRLDTSLGGPVIFKGGALRKMSLDFVECDNFTDVVVKQLRPDSLDLAATSPPTSCRRRLLTRRSCPAST